MSELLRAPTEHDIAAVVRLMSEHWPEPANEDLARRSWSSPDFELEHDARLDGASYVDVSAIGEGRVWIDARGRSSAAILDWAETRAREKGTRLLAGGWSSNEPLLEALERRGFHLVRRSHRMRIDLDDPTPEPDWPEGLEVRSFQPGDERAFYEAHQETFEDSWEPIEESYDEWAHWQLESHAFVPELWFLAVEDDDPVGFAICHPHSGDAKCGWVRMLGVRRPWRKRGLGRALLLHAFAEFRKRGLLRAGLGVDAESVTGANRLYEQAGMHVAARFDIYEKVVE
ncbi:MAG: GNAT family N-acetyltransferase [Gaiellaceae bacterium]